MIKKIKTKLKNHEHFIGSWLQIADTSVAEIMGKAGYDWVAVDLEHGHFSNQILADIFRALELGGTLPFARVAYCNAKDIKYALDSGARGIILPMIETAEQLQQGINWINYPPKGQRGVGYSRCNLFGRDFDNYRENIAENIFVVAQIEHIRAVDNIEQILTIKGLDAVMVGPYDLSGSMNLTGQFEHPDFLMIMEKIFQSAKNVGIPMGLHIVQPDKKLLEEKIKEGYQFIAYGIDAVFLYNACKNPL